MATSAGVSEHVHLNMGWDWRYTAQQVKEPRTFGNDTLCYCLEILHRQLKYHTSKFGGSNILLRLWFNEKVKGGRTVLFWCKKITQLWPMEMLAVAQHSPVLSIYSFEEHQEDDRKGSTGPWWESPSLPPDSCSSQDSEHNGITTKQWCCNSKTMLQTPSQLPPAMARCWSPLACHPSVCYRHCSGLGTGYQESRLHSPCF